MSDVHFINAAIPDWSLTLQEMAGKWLAGNDWNGSCCRNHGHHLKEHQMTFYSLYSKAAVSLTLSMALGQLVGCDASKEELQKTMAERDQLKAQVTTMQTSMDAMKKDLADAKTQAANCQQAPAQAAAPAAAAAAPAAAPAAPAGKAAKPAGKH